MEEGEEEEEEEEGMSTNIHSVLFSAIRVMSMRGVHLRW